MPKQKQSVHIPVLLQEVMDILEPREGDSYLDLTAGYGGHASEIYAITKASMTLVDRDYNAVEELKKKFGKSKNITVMHSDFLEASRKLVASEEKYNLILADLGVSSPHLDIASRGFSIQSDGPLDMRMDQQQQLTAREIVNDFDEAEIVQILRDYGQEPKAKRIANLIVSARPIETTQQLADIVRKAWPYGSRVHPATRTFQALRIAVNNELGQLAESLPLWLKLLKPGGRLAVISFHSLEDAVVKRFLKEHGGDRYDAVLHILTKKPLSASADELVFNPRARSARLRGARSENKK